MCQQFFLFYFFVCVWGDQNWQGVWNLPDKTGWTLLRRIVMARSRARLSTSWITLELEVNINAILLCSDMIITQNISPTIDDCTTDTIVANFAPLPFPAPNSLDTRTLQIWRAFHGCKFNKKTEIYESFLEVIA